MLKYSPKKFINAILFFAHKTDPKKLGILKLNKLLYYSDFEHYKKYGRSILGDIYVRMDNGPVPSISYNFYNAAIKHDSNDSISKELRSSIEICPTRVIDFIRDSIHPKKDFDINLFSESEIEIMEKIAKKYKTTTGTAMSEETHKEDTPWSKTAKMQPIDYKLALDENSVSEDYIKFCKQQEKEIEEIFS